MKLSRTRNSRWPGRPSPWAATKRIDSLAARLGFWNRCIASRLRAEATVYSPLPGGVIGRFEAGWHLVGTDSPVRVRSVGGPVDPLPTQATRWLPGRPNCSVVRLSRIAQAPTEPWVRTCYKTGSACSKKK